MTANDKRQGQETIDRLLILAAHRIAQAREECTFERLVYECFTAFPEQFGLRRYPEWPDSARVNKAWLRCRTDRGWLVGNVKEGFRLTDAGVEVAEQVKNSLNSGRGSLVKRRPAASRERYDAMLRFLRASDSFRRFATSEGGVTLTESEFRNMLGCTLQTPPRVLRQNLSSYRHAAEVYEDHQVVEFLKTCEVQMRGLLRGNATK
jgi:hypothetical protein